MPIHVRRMPEKSWPEAWLDLIEALRAYVEVEECLWEEFRREELEAGGEVLTRAQASAGPGVQAGVSE
jgi:hypothetical protein